MQRITAVYVMVVFESRLSCQKRTALKVYTTPRHSAAVSGQLNKLNAKQPPTFHQYEKRQSGAFNRRDAPPTAEMCQVRKLPYRYIPL